MVGRWNFPLAWSLFRRSMLIFRRLHNFLYFIFRCHFTWLDLQQGASPFCCKLTKNHHGEPLRWCRKKASRGGFFEAKLLLRKRASPSSRWGARMSQENQGQLVAPMLIEILLEILTSYRFAAEAEEGENDIWIFLHVWYEWWVNSPKSFGYLKWRYWSLFSAILGMGFPSNRINTAYIVVRIPPFFRYLKGLMREIRWVSSHQKLRWGDNKGAEPLHMAVC